MKYSEPIENFLNTVTQCVNMIDGLTTDIKYFEDATQDVLHKLELSKTSYHERARLAANIASLRQRRREVKDYYENIYPIVSWAIENKGVINRLKQLLGEVRKVEKHRENRYYVYKTDIFKPDETQQT